MAKSTTNWESAETWQRVVASILATGVKIDLRAVATYYGTTYDTLENRFRKLKKDAADLKAEVDGGDRGEVAVPSRTKSAPTTPRKPKTPKKGPLESKSVANGRITKKTPSKKKTVKEEQTGDDDGGLPNNFSGNFDDTFNSNTMAFGVDDDMFT
ncbi:hypothetical protein LTR37_010254 [Vermiconidia calcicola]|uniref:Uncharacterized protein n=1 Tax=Vermiconidia calcicola TaxID=1690605 RepID=A0ACC3N6Y2_9PEZI|nr:hypothetical protein LTR37_010254 [Vermiconidia calcicola]